MQATSNQHLYTHNFNSTEPTGPMNRKRKLFGADVSQKDNPEDIDAMRNRFIEVFVRSPPKVPKSAIPMSATFTRMNFIRGMYFEILRILMSYNKDDFHSKYLYLYPLGGLAKNMREMPVNKQERIKAAIEDLMVKFDLSDEERNTIVKFLDGGD